MASCTDYMPPEVISPYPKSAAPRPESSSSVRHMVCVDGDLTVSWALSVPEELRLGAADWS